ncbi:major facilitator superfamily protein [Actinidia rufa]|uniref:Major facilitator superfamily protein n=1 Tax=Actinidia rufa TaxID=165716 RepID=A0A7J0E7X2_9ERIC|nr:major facilitator superfamily protein [Actinidia rufa]
MLLLFPEAWATNFVHCYQCNNVNWVLFNPRTRGFNNIFYWGAQMIDSPLIGHIADFSFKSRRMRGLVGIGIVGLLGTGIWVGGLLNQLGYSRNDKPKRLDFKDSGSDFDRPFVLYFSYALLDTMFQTMIYWVMGALADDSETLSTYTGFFKGVQSAGATVAWQVDTHKVSFLSKFIKDRRMRAVPGMTCYTSYPPDMDLCRSLCLDRVPARRHCRACYTATSQ